MKHNAKRFLALLLCVAMCLSLMPTFAAAAADVPTKAADVQPREGEVEHPEIPIFENPEYTFAERAADLVARMTLAQKANQIIENPPTITASQLGGGALNVPATMNVAQYSWWSEALHGYLRDNWNPQSDGTKDNVSYPQSLSMGNTWDPELYYGSAALISDEIRERSRKNDLGNCINLNFYSPTVNMQRDPRWGRNEEAYSEDVLLNSVMGAAFVNGFEGNDMEGNRLNANGYKKALATIKHYTANNTENIRTSGGATTDLRALREYYTAPYRNVIHMADPASVMTAYSSLNSEPCSYSSYLMDTLLRRTFGFSGHITSDCDSTSTISNLNYINPRTGAKLTTAEQFAGALAHGEDLECSSGITSRNGNYSSNMNSMISSNVVTDMGLFTENTVDIAAHRLFTARMETGEFDRDNDLTAAATARTNAQKTVTDPSDENYSPSKNNYTQARLDYAKKEAAESVVMLKNDGLLPLNVPATGTYKVAIVGQHQTSMHLGLYSSEQRHSSDDWARVTIQRGLKEAFTAINPNVQFTTIESNSISNEQAIRDADVAIVVTGTDGNYSAEGRDRSSIALPNNQATLISNVGKLNPNTIAIMETCGPMQVTTFENDVKAILWDSFGGLQKGYGFAQIIVGNVNPSGHLTATWYQKDSDISSINDYNLYATNGSHGRTYMYYDNHVAPSYVFGYGLSYTTFAYSNLKLDKTAYDANDTLTATFQVKNTGSVAGKEVTQLYIAQPDAPKELNRPIRRLEGFEKVELQPGETKTITMQVKIPDLAFYSEADDYYKVDLGRYQVQVGEDSAHANLTADFTVSGTMEEYPVLLTAKPNQTGDDVLGIDQRLIFSTGVNINPQLTVAMSNEKLYGYIIHEQTSIIKSLESTPLPEGMTFTYSSNRPSVVRVTGDTIKAVGPGVATVTVKGVMNGHEVETDFVVYVEASANIEGIKINGEVMPGFSGEKYIYSVSDAGFGGKVPTVEAICENTDVKITVEQAKSLPGTATITATYGDTALKAVYRIGFGGQPVATDFTKGASELTAKKWTTLNANAANASLGADGLTITAEKGAFGTSDAPRNIYVEQGFGEWVAQTRMTLTGLSASGQQAGMIVYDNDENNIQYVYQQTSASAGVLRVYTRVNGTQSQAASVNVSAADGISLQIVKRDAGYGFNYSTDGKTWRAATNDTVRVELACPMVGVLANTGNTSAASFTATFDGLNVSKVALLYPRLASISLDGEPLTGFDKETFYYSYELPADAQKAPVVSAVAADPEIQVEIQQLEGKAFGTASVTVTTEIASATYVIAFNHGPMSDYFADGSMDDVWQVLRENESAYSVEKGKGLVLPTQRYDIYSTGAAWENCFVAPAMGNWRAVAKVHYPVRPNANYQQAMFLVWQDEDNYIRMNCQQNSLKFEPGRETGGSFSSNGFQSANGSASDDGTVTVYFEIERKGNSYTVSYSQNGTTFTSLGTVNNVDYADPKIGLFAAMNNSGTPIDVYYEYVAVTSIGGVEEMNNVQMLEWAAQNVADYVAADLPATAESDLAFSDIPHGYTMTVASSDPNVITAEGKVNRPATDKSVTLTITIAEGSVSASAQKVVKVAGSEGGCNHEYTATVTAPTCTEAGYTTHTCAKCGDSYKDTEVAALGHDWGEGVVTTPATETQEGVKTFTCSRCKQTRTEKIPMIGAGPTIDFTNPADASKFEIVGQTSAAIQEGVGLALVTTKSGIEPAKDQLEGDAATTPVDVVEVPVSGNWVATLTVDFSTNGASNGYYQFFGFYASEGDDYQQMAGIRGGDGAMQNFIRHGSDIVCDEKGVNSEPGFAEETTYILRIEKDNDTYTCYRSADGENFELMFAYEDTEINADKIVIDAYTGMTEGYQFTLKSLDIVSTGDAHTHTWDDGKVTKEATCTAAGVKTFTCAECGKTKTEAIAALGHDMVKGEVTAPTCTEAGYTTYACSRCDATEKRDTVPATGHKYGDAEVTKEATCEIAGEKTATCAACGDKKTEAIPALGHEWDEGTVTKEPTTEEEGEKTFTCARCNETKTEPIDKLEVHDCPSKDFSDVPGESDWAHAGIDYCVENGLMNGTSATLFSPKGSVTRAQLVTILYRVAGTPEVTEPSKFTDVPAGQWYTDPIAWAAANGIVTGMNETTFAPMNKITREQIATILYRYTDGATAEGSIDSFPDATKVSGWAKDALTWAVANELITGVKAADGTVTLNPTANATRAQIASIIMRYLEAGEAEAQ